MEIEYHQFPIHDRSLPDNGGFMYRVCEVLADNEKRGKYSKYSISACSARVHLRFPVPFPRFIPPILLFQAFFISFHTLIHPS
jgi:hypothetical protein